MTDARCEPPPHLRGVDGWHVVWRLGWDRNDAADLPAAARWTRPPGMHGEWCWVFEGRGELVTALEAAKHGWRYGGPAPDQSSAPVPSPDAVARLVEAGRKVLNSAQSDDETFYLTVDDMALGDLETALAAFPEEAHD